MSADGTNARPLTSGNRVSEGNLAISPDNTQLMFTMSANEKYEGYHNARIYVMPLAGGAMRQVSPADATYQVSDAAWSKDGKTIYFHANLGVHDRVLEVGSRVPQASAGFVEHSGRRVGQGDIPALWDAGEVPLPGGPRATAELEDPAIGGQVELLEDPLVPALTVDAEALVQIDSGVQVRGVAVLLGQTWVSWFGHPPLP